MRMSVSRIAAVCCSLVLMVAPALCQDFQKSYSLSPGGRISVKNVSGDIEVAGYNGSSVSAIAYREGRDRDKVEIIDESTAAQVDLRVRYAENCNCDASVRFVLQIPLGTKYDFDSLSTASGDIHIGHVSGKLAAKTASGNVTVSRVVGQISISSASGDLQIEEAVGSVIARTASGDVEATVRGEEGSGDLVFSSASGNVTVTIPSQSNADVDISTASGELRSDFPLTIEERENRGKRAFGRIGTGTARLKISSASGNVRLART